MVTEFLRHKWHTCFVANDVNKDGYISKEDANLFADRFIEHHKMSEERGERLKSEFQAYWNDNFMYNREKIYPETFAKLMTEEYLADKKTFKDRMTKVLQKAVDIFDANGDGKISYDEFVTVCKCWGINTFHSGFLDGYPQTEPWYIDNEVLRDSWIEFYTNDDEKKSKLEIPVLYGFRIIDQM